MTNTQINDLADYIIDLEEGLMEWDYDNIAMQTEIPIIYQKIKLLMDETFNTPAEDKEMKIVLASMEMKLRKCLDCVKNRIGVNN